MKDMAIKVTNLPEPGYRISEIAKIVREKYGTKTTAQGILYLLQKGKLKEGEHYNSVGGEKRRSIKISPAGLDRILLYYDLKHSNSSFNN